jgi:hypothetical protein
MRNMKRNIVLALVIGTVAALTTSAWAAVHLKPPNKNPSFNDQGLVLNSTGALAGLGNEDIFIGLDATANATATCTNPAGQTQPPGQNPAPVSVSGGQSIPAEEIKNGNVSFNVTTEPPVTPIPGAPDCPNPQWTENITDLSFTSAVITVEQPVGTVVLTVSCTFSSPTSNGPVPGGNVSCTSS